MVTVFYRYTNIYSHKSVIKTQCYRNQFRNKVREMAYRIGTTHTLGVKPIEAEGKVPSGSHRTRIPEGSRDNIRLQAQ